MSLRGGSSSKMMNELEEEENLSDDDNAQIELEESVETEDPLLLAIDDLEGRVISAIDELKLHPGVKTAASAAVASSVHEELAIILRPVLEVAAHTGPSVARTYYRGVGPEGIEASVEDAYERIISDLVLPVVLEIAQSDTIPAKRCASLEFFRNLWNEAHKAGSWLDSTNVMSPNSGPYGPGGSHSANVPTTPAMRAVMKRRQVKRQTREGEILRYWVEAACACLVAGVFTDEDAEGAVVSRAIIAASASLRPALSHVAQRIRDTDDRGASRLYGPVMKMVEGVLKKLVLGSSENVRAAAIKFLEIVILCCSHKPQDGAKKRGPVVSRMNQLLKIHARVTDDSHHFHNSCAFLYRLLKPFHSMIYRQDTRSLPANH
jgi:symplekin